MERYYEKGLPAGKETRTAKTEKTGESAKKPEPTGKEKPYRETTGKKNFIGFLAGPGGYSSDFEDFETLKNHNTGAKYYENSLNGSLELFYKRKTKSGWEPAFSAGIMELGDEEYTQSGNQVNVEAGLKYLDLGCGRRLGRLFFFFLSAGADFLSYMLTDPVPLSGIYINHENFEGETIGAHARAALEFTPGNFIFRLGAKKLFFFGENKFTAKLYGSGSRKATIPS